MHGLVRHWQAALTVDGLQIAGGINLKNAQQWIDRGASKVIVTSYLFPDAKFSLKRLIELEELVGRDRLVVDVRYSNP
jgi:phosphoribosylformimino-5-aminoimidazole carboxamide ribotide isomerase